MLFYPYGQLLKEVVDPEKLSREYQIALRCAQQTTHYQWKELAVTKVESPITVTSDITDAALQGTSGVGAGAYIDLDP